MKEPLVQAGLRALREEAPSDESRRATLARLGLADEPQRPASRKSPLAASSVRWLLAGVVLGVLAFVVRHWFV